MADNKKIITLDHIQHIKEYIDGTANSSIRYAIDNELKSYLDDKLEEASEFIQSDYKTKYDELLTKIQAAEQHGTEEELKKLRLQLDALEANTNDKYNALDALKTQLENLSNSYSTLENGVMTGTIFSAGQLDELINTALIEKTKITDDMVETPNVYTSNLVALIGKFGKIKTANLEAGDISGHTITSGNTYNGVPVWKLGTTGEGWLAKGNISWDEDGDITLGPNVTIGYDQVEGIEGKLEEIADNLSDTAQNRIKDLNERITQANTNIEVAQNTFNSAMTDLNNTLSAQLGEQLNQINNIKTDISGINDNVESLSNNVDELGNNINENKEQLIASFNEQIANALTTAKNAAESYTDSKYAALSAEFEIDYTSLSEQLNAAIDAGDEAAIQQLQQLQQNLENKIAEESQKYTQVSEALSAINQDIDGIRNAQSAGLDPDDIADLLNASMVEGTTITNGSIASPSMLTQKLVSLVGTFGTINASKIVGTTIQGYTMSSPLDKKDAYGQQEYEKDANGNWVYELLLDENGNPVRAHDEQGNPLGTDDAPVYMYAQTLEIIDGQPTYVPIRKKVQIPLNDAAWYLNSDGSGQVANGKFKWDKDGNVTMRGITISYEDFDESAKNAINEINGVAAAAMTAAEEAKTSTQAAINAANEEAKKTADEAKTAKAAAENAAKTAAAADAAVKEAEQKAQEAKEKAQQAEANAAIANNNATNAANNASDAKTDANRAKDEANAAKAEADAAKAAAEAAKADAAKAAADAKKVADDAEEAARQAAVAAAESFFNDNVGNRLTKIDSEGIYSGTIAGDCLRGQTIVGAHFQSSKKIDDTDIPTWKINDDGDGYFASKNISWNADGELTVNGHIYGNIGDGNNGNNGDLTISDSHNQPVTVLSGNYIYDIVTNAEGTDTERRYINISSGIPTTESLYIWKVENNTMSMPEDMSTIYTKNSYTDSKNGLLVTDMYIYNSDTGIDTSPNGRKGYYTPIFFNGYVYSAEATVNNGEVTYESLDGGNYILLHYNGIEVRYNRANDANKRHQTVSITNNMREVANTNIYSDGTIYTTNMIAKNGEYYGTIYSDGEFSGKLNDVTGTIKNATISNSDININAGSTFKALNNSNTELLSIAPANVLTVGETRHYIASETIQYTHKKNTDITYSESRKVAEFSIAPGDTVSLPKMQITSSVYQPRKKDWAGAHNPSPIIKVWLQYNEENNGDTTIIKESIYDSTTSALIKNGSAYNGRQYSWKNEIAKKTYTISSKAKGKAKLYMSFECKMYDKQPADYASGYVTLTIKDNIKVTSSKVQANTISIGSNGILIYTASGGMISTVDGDITIKSALTSNNATVGLRVDKDGVWVQSVAEATKGKWFKVSVDTSQVKTEDQLNHSYTVS